MTTVLAGLVEPGTVVLDGGRRVTITRRHQSRKGKALLSYRHEGGAGMVELDDTERLTLAP